MSTSQTKESTATCEHEAEPNDCAFSVELFIKHFIINDIVLDKDWMDGIRDNTKIAAPLYVAVSHVFRSKHVLVELCVFFDDKRTRSYALGHRRLCQRVLPSSDYSRRAFPENEVAVEAEACSFNVHDSNRMAQNSRLNEGCTTHEQTLQTSVPLIGPNRKQHCSKDSSQ